MIVRLKNDIGMVKEAKIGFSFTTFFFGAFVPALRGDWKYAGIMLVCAIITSGISTLVFPFALGLPLIISTLNFSAIISPPTNIIVLSSKFSDTLFVPA